MKKDNKNNGPFGNAQEVMNNYLEEMKMVNKSPQSFYSHNGGVNTIAIK